MDEQDNDVGAAIDFSILSDLKYLSVDAFSLWILARFTGQGQDVPLPLSLHTFRLGYSHVILYVQNIAQVKIGCWVSCWRTWGRRKVV